MNKENTYNISKKFLKLNQLLWRKSFAQNVRSVFYIIDSLILMGCKKAKYEDNGKKKVLIVYNMALGDGIMFYEVNKSFREVWPKDKYEITIICQKAFKQLYEVSGVFDKVIPMDFSGSVVNLSKRRALFKELRKVCYDIVYDPVGSEDATTNVYVTRAANGKEKIGVLDINLKHQLSNRRRKRIYNRVIEINKPGIHLIDYYGTAIRELGAKNCVSEPAHLPVLEAGVELPEKYYIVFPVASMDVKKWDVKNYAYIAEQIQKKTGLPMVVCGTNHDRPSIEEMLSYTSNLNYIDVIGKTDIMQFTSVIGGAEIVVTNDTSAYHIAVARDVNTFMICGGYTYDRYANYDYTELGRRKPTLITHKMDCYNCNNHCKYADFKVFPCLGSITKEEAWEEISGRI
ncbi:glycosyltransferase family 9 protein [Lachnospira multipara]|uniref:glycosyltransferase family 9 protein n=1 Tax=Lachnospira multipara TaxID=28051 RepID=UPI000486BECE|nr:glycosyltransferase family 9 protein [Lachnospira multipara]